MLRDKGHIVINTGTCVTVTSFSSSDTKTVVCFLEIRLSSIPSFSPLLILPNTDSVPMRPTRILPSNEGIGSSSEWNDSAHTQRGQKHCKVSTTECHSAAVGILNRNSPRFPPKKVPQNLDIMHDQAVKVDLETFGKRSFLTDLAQGRYLHW